MTIQGLGEVAAPLPADRYRAAGLDANPFAVGRPVPFVDRGLPPPAAVPGAPAGTLIQIIGGSGTGKSTHLEQWCRLLPGPCHLVPSAPYRHRWSPAPVGPVVYGDEIDRMPRFLRRRWFRTLARAKALAIVATHVDLAAEARRAGLTVVTHHLASPDVATLRAIVTGRMRWAAIGSVDPRVGFTEADLVRIHGAAAGSLHIAEEHCHRLVALRVASRG